MAGKNTTAVEDRGEGRRRERPGVEMKVEKVEREEEEEGETEEEEEGEEEVYFSFWAVRHTIFSLLSE